MCGNVGSGGQGGATNYDLLLGQYNANLNPNLRNLSRSGNIVYRTGGLSSQQGVVAGGVVIPSPSSQLSGTAGISFVETSILEVEGNNTAVSVPSPQQPTPPPPDRRLLVRGLSRNAFTNIPQYSQQQEPNPQQQYYWQLPPHHHQQQPLHLYHLNNTFEQQYQLQQQFLSKVQRRGVAGSQPDISRCNLNNSSSGVNPASLAMTPSSSPFSGMVPGGGGGMMGRACSQSSHQVAIDMPSTAPSAVAAPTSPQTTRRLLPRIITKKTDNSTVVLVGETRNPRAGAQAPSYPDALSTTYISPSGSGPGWRTTDSSSSTTNRNELSSSQILSTFSFSATSSSTPKKTEPPSSSEGSVQKYHNIHPASRAGGTGGGSSSAPVKTTQSSSKPSSKLTFQGKQQKSCGDGKTTATTTTAQPKPPSKGKGVQRVVQWKNVPSYISAHFQNAPIQHLKHPLEENIFSSLFITLFAVAVAIIVGVPILCVLGVIVVGVVGVRYAIAILHGLGSYTRFICSSRQHPSNSRSLPPQIFPRDRLAFANDVRWLGKKRRSRCQSIIHTLLVFEGCMDVNTLRHLIQTRVLRAETPEGELAYPRLLQKLVCVTAGYLWELDVTFDIQNHVFSGPTHFKSEKQLQQYIGKLLTQELPLSRPLWEIRLFPSYYGSGKDTMAILRVHQCLADGMSLIRILSHSLADHQLMHVPQRPHFAGMSFGFNLLRSFIVGPLTIFLWWFTTFRDKNLFSVPLPKWRGRRQGRRKWWRRLFCKSPLTWFRSQTLVTFKNYPSGDEEQERVSFSSSLGSTSGSGSSGSGTDSGNESDHGGGGGVASEHSNSSNSSGAKKRAKSAQVFQSPVQSSSKDDELTASSPRGSGSNAQQISCQDPTAETGTAVQEDQKMGTAEGKSTKPVGSQRGFLNRSTRRCLGKDLSGSKCSLQSPQHQDPAGNKEKLEKGTSSSSGKGKQKSKNKKKRKKRKRAKARGSNHRHHHPHRRRRLLGDRKSSLASNSSGSSCTSTSSSRSTFSSLSSSSRPATWNVVWSAPMTLPKVARVKQIMRSSYNDVLLSAAAGSVRMYMQDQGVPYPGDVQVHTN